MKALVKIAQKRGMKVVIVTDSNSAADNVVQTIASHEYIAVRVHSLGLERTHLLKDARKCIKIEDLKPTDPEPNDSGDDNPDRFVIDTMAKDKVVPNMRVEAANEETQITEGRKDDNVPIVFNDNMLKESFTVYKKAQEIMKPDDPRMQMVRSAIWTWMLRVLLMIDVADYSRNVELRLGQLAKSKLWQEF